MTMTSTGSNDLAIVDPVIPRGRPAARLGIAGALFASAIPFLAQAWFLITAPRLDLMASMPDDAFYYLEIGQRAARGEGFTFDGTTATSGYHPLWQWIVTTVEWMLGNDTGQVRAVRLLGLLLIAAAFAIVCRVVWRAAGPVPALGGLLLASHSTGALQTWSSGMETPVVVLGLSLCFWALHEYLRRPTARGAVLVGMASAVLVLARLDMAAVVPLLGVAVALRKPRLRNLTMWVGGGAVIGIPYVIHHLLTHDALLTTSATVKQYWVDDHVEDLGGLLGAGHRTELAQLLQSYIRAILGHTVDGPVPVLSTVGGLVVLVLAGCAAYQGVRRHRDRGVRVGPLGEASATMAGIAGLKLAIDLVVVPLWVLTWYASVGQVTAAWIIGAAAGAGLVDVFRRAPRIVAAPVAALAMIAVLPSGLSLLTEGTKVLLWQQEIDRASSWLLENAPDGHYGAFDAGLLGYRLDGAHSVENLDGLVNDQEFAEYLARRPSRFEVVQREGVDILINDIAVDERESTWACATTLWEGSVSVSNANPSPDRIYVLDVTGCR